MAAAVAPAAQITAFEIESGNAKATRRNIGLNSLEGARVVRVAVSDRHGDIGRLEFGKSTLEHRLALGETGPGTWIRTVSIDDWCSGGQTQLRPDFVKIDVEGSEVNVLNGMRRTIENCAPSLIVEVHSEEHRTQCLRFLRTFEYRTKSLLLGRPSSNEWVNTALIATSAREPRGPQAVRASDAPCLPNYCSRG